MNDAEVTPERRNVVTFFRASRLEALLEPLLYLMEKQPPDGVLASYTVVAAHPGLQQWLVREIARRRFQLSDRVARVYISYLVYLPERLKARAAGRRDVAERTFLDPL